MSEISELEVKLEESQKKLSELQYEINSIKMEMVKMKGAYTPAQNQQQTSPYRQALQQQPAQQQRPVQQQPVQQQPYAQGQPVQQQRPVQQQPYAQGQPVQSQYVQQQHPVQQQGYAQGQPVQNQYMPQQAAQNRPVPQRQKSAKDTETIVGIKVMAIVASVLVFISFVLFAMYLIPGLTDEIKMALMFIVSFALTGIGLGLWSKKRDNIFLLALGACGIGAIYISLFVSNIYFHMIDQIPLYILLLIWAACVLFLSRIKPLLFEIIGLTGIVISILFGTIQCVSDKDSLLLGILSIYMVIGILAFMIFRIKDNIHFVVSNLAAAFGAFIIVCGASFFNGNGYFPAGVMVLFAIGLMIACLMLINEKNYHYLPIFGAVYFIIMTIGIASMIAESRTESSTELLLTLLVSVILYVGIEVYYKKEIQGNLLGITTKSGGLIAWEIVILFAATMCLIMHEPLNEYIGVVALIIPLVVYGFICEDRQSQISAVVLYFIVAIELSLNPWAGLFYVILIFALFVIMMYVNKNSYSEIIKLIAYIVFMIGINVWIFYLMGEYDWNPETTLTILLMIDGALNFAAVKTPFGRNWLTEDEEKSITITSYVINAILMFTSLFMMNDSDYAVTHVLIVLTAILLFTINSFALLKSENTLKVIYVGLKFTMLLICILASFDAVNYVISISVFIMAILLILLGFKLKLKSLRVYGLVTTMIFAVKLVMIDITYDNVLGNALSFFISGLICFGISALYSIADKKLSAGSNEQKNLSNMQ